MRTPSPILSLITLAMLFSACETEKQREERLARIYCGSCHQFPEPALLDKNTWLEKVLPQMAFRMGMDASLVASIPEADLPYVLPTIPDHPMVSEEEWQAIKSYFESNAPDSLTIPHFKVDSLTGFQASTIALAQNSFPLISLLKIDTASRSIYTSNRSGLLHRFDYQFKLADSLKVQSPVTSLLVLKQDEIIATRAGIMDPNDQPAGTLLHLVGEISTTMIDSLKRPVHTEMADLNGDKRNDLVVCSFGNYTGELSVFEALENGQFRKHLISNLPGARKTEVRDFNGDGLPDILVLFTQGDEQITLLTNAGNFQFRVNTLLRFSPVFGSSFFETIDFNGDGHFDLLYTNGDNADYSTTLKPYHGIRIYLNDGKNQFTESTFVPMNGCSMALARDFDKDGDLDLAAISFFPDFRRNPEQGFFYFKNTNGQFTAHSTPLGSRGRWLLMDAGDIDGDSDLDILVSALDFNNGVPQSLVEKWKNQPFALLYLNNQLVP